MTNRSSMPRVGRRELLALAASGIGVAAQQMPRGHSVLADDGTPAAGTAARGSVLPLTGARRTAFDTFVAEAMSGLGVLGAAVAVVTGGEVTYLEGFGARALDDSAPVTPDTLMMVDSLTKPATTLMAATLVDDGGLAWDTPIVEVLPAFALADPESTARVTVGDVFCHSAGVPRDDLEIMFNASRLTPARLIASAATLPLTSSVGEQFQYSNHLFAIGGYAVAAAADAGSEDLLAAYHTAMRARVLGPIVMDESTFDLDEVLEREDFAVPAAPDRDGNLQQLSLSSEDAFGSAVEPAGGMWSTPREMAAFVQTQLAGGIAPNGNRVVSREQLARIWEPRIAVPPDPALPDLIASVQASYGLGWFAGEYLRQPVLSHSGGIAGFISECVLLPESDVGVVVLTNGGTSARVFALAVPFRLFELLFDLPPQVEAILAQEADASRQPGPATPLAKPDPAAIAPYLGRYANPQLGEVTLRLDRDQLLFDAAEVASEIRPSSASGAPGDFLFVDPPLSILPVTLGLVDDPAGQPALELRVGTEDVPPYVFRTAATTDGGTPAL